MKKRFSLLAVALTALLLCISCNSKPKIQVADDESIVYFCKDITPENILKLYEALGVKQEGKIGLKVHFGEEGNQNFLNPELLRPLVEKVHLPISGSPLSSGSLTRTVLPRITATSTTATISKAKTTIKMVLPICLLFFFVSI